MRLLLSLVIVGATSSVASADSLNGPEQRIELASSMTIDTGRWGVGADRVVAGGGDRGEGLVVRAGGWLGITALTFNDGDGAPAQQDVGVAAEFGASLGWRAVRRSQGRFVFEPNVRVAPVVAFVDQGRRLSLGVSPGFVASYDWFTFSFAFKLETPVAETDDGPWTGRDTSRFSPGAAVGLGATF